MFGSFTWDALQFADNMLVPSSSHKWLLQFRNDISLLAQHTELDEFATCLHADPRLIFTDSHIRASFLACNPRVLWIMLNRVAISPDGTWHVAQLPSIGHAPVRQPMSEPEKTHVCQLHMDDGTVCGAAFHTHQALVMHQTKSRKSSEHGKRS